MFKKSLKLFLISFLCIFTLSCTFISKNTGKLQFILPSSSSLNHVRVINSRAPSDIEYHIVIIGNKNNYTPFSYDKTLSHGNVEINSMPIGDYTITITGSDGKYKYFIKDTPSLNFEINSGKNTKLNINLDCEPINTPNPDPSVKKGTLEVTFKNGPTTAIQLNVKLFKASAQLKSYTVSSDKKLTIPSLELGTDYKITVVGQNTDNKYEYTESNINIVEGVNQKELSLTVTSIKPSPTEDIKPNPAEGIYCVNEIGGDDSTANSNGAKAFSTVSKALKMSNIKTLYVKGTISETNTLSLPKGIEICAQPNSQAIINTSAKIGFQLVDGGLATINGIEINHTDSSGSDSFAIKMPDSVKLILGPGTKIKTANKIAISEGSQGTLTLNSVDNIYKDNQIYVLSGAKINVTSSFNASSGNIVISKENVGGETGSQILLYENASTASTELATASRKFSVLNNKYSIDENGKLQAYSENTKPVTKVYDFTSLSNNIANGGTFQIEENITFNKELIIKKDVTIQAVKAVQVIRDSSYTGRLIQIDPAATLTIKGSNSVNRITIDGKSVESTEPIIACYGNLTLENCNIQNCDSNAASMSTAEKGTASLYFGEGSSAVNGEQKLLINNSSFVNNKGRIKGVNGGGVITIEPHKDTVKCSVTITNCSLDKGNTYQGAIDIIGNTKVKPQVQIKLTEFKNNQSSKNGGAINAKNSTVTLESVSMSNNTAKANGGGIAMNTSDITINNSTIKDNYYNATLDSNNKKVDGKVGGLNGYNFYVVNPGKLMINNNEITVNKSNWINEPINTTGVPTIGK